VLDEPNGEYIKPVGETLLQAEFNKAVQESAYLQKSVAPVLLAQQVTAMLKKLRACEGTRHQSREGRGYRQKPSGAGG
jgi:hypothetical protein